MRAAAAAAALTAAQWLTACGGGKPGPASVLLFTGKGASKGDLGAIENLLRDGQWTYSRANTPELNRMSEPELRQYRLLIIPGGNYESIGKGLTASTAATVRNAIRNGVNYLGFCAGAFFAGNAPYNGLNLTSGVRFGFYSVEARGTRKAPVAVAFAAGPTLDMYWEDGPQLAGWGDVVAKYPDGMPAIVEGSFGSGWVVLAGVHPEAPASWRRGLDFRTPVEADWDYANQLIRAALNRQPLPHY